MPGEHHRTDLVKEVMLATNYTHAHVRPSRLGPGRVGSATAAKKDGTRMVTNLCPTAATFLAGTRCILALLLLGY